jgi:erythronate-4-phosphate dehydrogenase
MEKAWRREAPVGQIDLNRVFRRKAYDSFVWLLRNKSTRVSARGFDTVKALVTCCGEGNIDAADAILDVWEGEPNIDTTLLYKVFVGTPHIAGYSADGKANATRMSLDALCRHFKLKGNYQINPPMPVDTPNAADYLQLYNPMVDSLALKQHPEQFEQLRGNYPIRREPHAYGLQWID